MHTSTPVWRSFFATKVISNLTAYDKLLARWLLLSFVLPLRVQIISVLLICTFWVVRDAALAAKKPLGHYGWALLLGSIALLYVICFPFINPEYRPEVAFEIEKRASLLLIPIAFVHLRARTRKVISRQLPFFVLGSFLCCLAGNLGFLWLAYGWATDGLSPEQFYRGVFEDITDVHPTYMGMYLCFAVAIMLMTPSAQERFKGWSMGFVLFTLFIFIFLLMPKAPVIALLIVIGYYTWNNRKQKSRTIPVLAGLLLASVVAFNIPSSSGRVGEFSVLVKDVPGASPINNTVSMRQIILDIDLRLLKGNWLSGTGPGRITELLNDQYAAYSQRLNLPLGVYNTHNEYLNVWLTFGLLGILLFIGLLTVQFIKAFQWRNHLYIALLIILTTTFLTENVFARQRGVVFFAFFTSLFIFNGINRKNRTKAKAIVTPDNYEDIRQEESQYSEMVR